MDRGMKIGVLAIQGDFSKHFDMCRLLKVDVISVKTPSELDRCDGLIIPGGESTTFVNLIQRNNLYDKIKKFALERPLFGTCAGLIILAKKITNNGVESLDILDMEVARNAYGRQVNSFIDTLRIDLGKGFIDFEGVFIRAPKISRIGAGIKVIGWHGEDSVLAEKDNILVATFHPELTDDTRIHEYFLQKIRG